MASTIQLQRTVTYASQFVRNAPLAFLNMSNDPAFSNADWVKQFILSAPMAWRWNRTSVSDVVTFPTFVTVPGTSDYSVSLPTFGWLEKATLYDTQNGFAVFELSTKLDSAIDNNPNQPTRISVQNDDGAGHITFRIFPAPDSVYNCCLEFQNAASQFTLLSQTWSPIPDYFSYLFNQGFIAKTYEYLNDPRFQGSMQLFLQQLAGASEGLSETQKNIWLEDKLNSLRQTQAVQQGRR